MTTTARKARTKKPAGLAEGSRRLAAAIHAQQQLVAAAVPRAAEAGAEDVHHNRVAARRLRSLLKTFRPLLHERRARLYRVDLRSYARAFTPVREADVLSDLLRDLARSDASFESPDLQRLNVALEDGREGARGALRRRLQEPVWRALAAALLSQSREGPPLLVEQAGLADIMKLVLRSWRKSLRLLKKPAESAAVLHERRLALKHCRYALEAVADVKPQPAARLLRRLRAAQDSLGEHRDTVAALHWVGLHSRTIGRTATARLVVLLQKREQVLRRQAAKRAAAVLPAYERWHAATRPIRKAAGSGPG